MTRGVSPATSTKGPPGCVKTKDFPPGVSHDLGLPTVLGWLEEVSLPVGCSDTCCLQSGAQSRCLCQQGASEIRHLRCSGQAFELELHAHSLASESAQLRLAQRWAGSRALCLETHLTAGVQEK